MPPLEQMNENLPDQNVSKSHLQADLPCGLTLSRLRGFSIPCILIHCSAEKLILFIFFFQAEDGIRDDLVTGVQTCALPISKSRRSTWVNDTIYWFFVYSYC